MHSTTTSNPLVAIRATVTRLDPVWLSDEVQGWHVQGTMTSVARTENWAAAVDDVGNALGGRWLSTTKGWASEDEIKAILAAIDTAIIMSGADE